jgi:hypothetical protein
MTANALKTARKMAPSGRFSVFGRSGTPEWTCYKTGQGNLLRNESKVKIKLYHYRPGQTLGVPEAEAPEFLDNRHMKVVRLSALRTGRLYPQQGFLVLISVRA